MPDYMISDQSNQNKRYLHPCATDLNYEVIVGEAK